MTWCDNIEGSNVTTHVKSSFHGKNSGVFSHESHHHLHYYLLDEEKVSFRGPSGITISSSFTVSHRLATWTEDSHLEY